MSQFNQDYSNDETIEATPRLLANSASGSSRRIPVHRHIALVEGSSPHLSAETRAVLRTRLRIVCLLLIGGFAAFLLWTIAARPMVEIFSVGREHLFYSHVGVIIVLSLCAWKLCAKCDVSTRGLRIAEALVFGVPTIFFLEVNFEKLRYCAEMPGGRHVPEVAGAWTMLIFCYAMFVPNNWRRAAVVLSLIGMAPIMVMGVAYFRLPMVAELLTTSARGVFTEHVLIMTLSVVTGVVGVHSIGTLRKEAFDAKQLGQYRLKKLLGSGGMGEVYLGEHQMMKRPCAIKVVRPEKAGDAKVLARFEREVRLTAKLSHWNSIDVFDYGRTDDGTFYYVMEFLPGHNFGDLVELHGPMPQERIVYLMRQVCDALFEAHGIGLIHRDIKPANLYCAHRGGMFDVAKVLDYGLAKPIAETADATLTQEGAITGSPLFMPPEQAAGSGDVDARSDIYSLGAVMYFLATGRAPFVHEQPLKVIIAHATEEPEPPRLSNPALSPELEDVILRAMEKQPEDRFQTARELSQALADLPLYHDWTTDDASHWWINHGCPKKKALDAEAFRAIGA